MNQIKKFAWSGTSVAIAALMAMTMLLSTTSVASATVTAPIGTAPVMAAGLTETWTVTYTESGTVGITTAALTFPTGFVVPQGTITGATALGGGACTGVAATGSGQVVSFTMTSCATAAGGTNNLVVPGVKNPTTAGATASGFKVTTSVDATGATGAAVNIWNITMGATPSTVPGDNASTVALTFTASHTSTNTGNTGAVTIATDLGTFQGTVAAGTVLDANGAISTDGKTITGLNDATIATTTPASVTLRAPGAPGTATITFRVTPAGGGVAVIVGVRTVTFTTPAAVPGAVTGASVTTPTGTLGVSATGTATVTTTFTDANGNAPIPGGTVSVTTTLGVLSAPTNGTCTNQSCSGTMPSTGVFSVTLTAGGVAGNGTVTFTSNSISATKTFRVSGGVNTVSVTVQTDVDGAGAGTTFVNSATPNTASFTVAGTNSGGRLSVNAIDTAGNRVPSAAVTAAFSPTSCGAAPTITTAGTAAANVILGITSGSLTAPIGTVCTVTVTSGTKTATTTYTVGSTLAATSTLEVTAQDMATVSTQAVTVTVKSSTGALVGDGTSVTLVVSAGAVASATATTINGVATFTYVSPGSAQQVNLTAVAGTVTASKAIGVGTAGPTPTTPSGDGTLTAPSFGSGNIGNAVFAGGTTEQLAAQVIAAGGTLVWVQDANGNFRVFSTTAPAFVNGPFVTAFTGGFSGATAVTVVK